MSVENMCFFQMDCGKAGEDEEFGVKGKSVVEKIKKSLADDGKKSDEEKKNSIPNCCSESSSSWLMASGSAN